MHMHMKCTSSLHFVAKKDIKACPRPMHIHTSMRYSFDDILSSSTNAYHLYLASTQFVFSSTEEVWEKAIQRPTFINKSKENILCTQTAKISTVSDPESHIYIHVHTYSLCYIYIHIYILFASYSRGSVWSSPRARFSPKWSWPNRCSGCREALKPMDIIYIPYIYINHI
jgi:hypothetical protein